MSLPSSSLQSNWVLSNPCWDAHVLFYSCIFLAAWGCDLVGELGRDLGYEGRGRELVTRCSEGVRRGKY